MEFSKQKLMCQGYFNKHIYTTLLGMEAAILIAISCAQIILLDQSHLERVADTDQAHQDVGKLTCTFLKSVHVWQVKL